jgi:hypothetical protein
MQLAIDGSMLTQGYFKRRSSAQPFDSSANTTTPTVKLPMSARN